MRHSTLVVTLAVFASAWTIAPPVASARTLLRDICRIKGQEENVLRGIGLVVGLSGTGEAADPATMRALARAMEVMGAPIPEVPLGGGSGLKDLEKVKNIALVWVTARVPAVGSRRGDKLDCYVSGINGKSLAGGRLAFAALQGPNTLDKRVYALCEGAVFLEDPTKPLSGVVHGGCQMEEDVFTPFIHDGAITLVIDKHHANFNIVAELVESLHRNYSDRGDDFIRPIDATNIVVKIPEEYANDPVAFVAIVMETEVYSPEPEARVVINQRSQLISISGDVTIGDVVVMHKNVEIQAGAGESAGFAKLDADNADAAKLQALVDALSSIKVPPADVIEIIKSIDRAGKLHGRLMIE